MTHQITHTKAGSQTRQNFWQSRRRGNVLLGLALAVVAALLAGSVFVKRVLETRAQPAAPAASTAENSAAITAPAPAEIQPTLQ